MYRIKQGEIRLLFLSVACVFILSLGHAVNSKMLILMAIALFMGMTFFMDKRYFLPIMLFFLPWSPVLKFSPGTHSFYSMIVPCLFMLVILEYFIKNKKYKLKFIFIPLFLSAYTLTIKLVNGIIPGNSHFFFILLIIFIPMYMHKYKDEINFETCVLFITTGVLSACFASKILMTLPHMVGYINVYTWKRMGLTRLSGFYGDANFYSVHILVAIACLLLTLKNTKKTISIMVQLLSIIALIYFGMLSVSKMFILCLVLMGGIWLFCFLIVRQSVMYKLKFLLFSVVILIAFFSSSLFTEQLNQYLIRFSMVSDAQSLTTGRSELVNMYIEYFMGNLNTLFFGMGLSPVYVNGYSSHNTIIQMIYQLGILGSILMIGWWRMVYKGLSNKIKLSFVNSMYLLMIGVAYFLPWLSLEMLYFDEFFYITILVFISKNYLSSSQVVKENEGAVQPLRF
ncbi:O-antigen ligase family protein [Cytobacillus solani]|uniref:Uncharacterized protein n=1 Tax=Cytobacillus solani TaxID=1637975 RepID=A0A0Q3SFF9_9BACI|nr:hypothetical protein [Cytobacillus solani]KQL17972.1 hypothetical protein AN957_04675 [Cytobacillus solani]